jgi:hypothetical protein
MLQAYFWQYLNYKNFEIEDVVSFCVMLKFILAV